MAKWNNAAIAALSAPKHPGRTDTATEGRKPATERKIATPAQRAPAALRPAYRIATYAGFEGKRFVAHGLSDAQADALSKAAQLQGIPQQP